jgi:hypothetical protein
LKNPNNSNNNKSLPTKPKHFSRPKSKGQTVVPDLLERASNRCHGRTKSRASKTPDIHSIHNSPTTTNKQKKQYAAAWRTIRRFVGWIGGGCQKIIAPPIGVSCNTTTIVLPSLFCRDNADPEPTTRADFEMSKTRRTRNNVSSIVVEAVVLSSE